ncbi:12499_t:CDS:2 [Ambispora leptoticha]|uniref:12499_t:CDS:1 n=1 Tax=Ambispora leptoticha TaxID=144679 RepID=A0A9N9CSC7_9GLOM|nr:12499_t:CDS:2 [Ambispora leptoticha]
MELQNVDPLSNSILPTTISLINGPALQQQPTCLTTSNININCINDESDEQSDNEFEEQLELYEGQTFQTAEEAYVIVESFAHSNGFGIRKGRVEKDSSNGREISRSFICRHAGKPSDKNKSYKTEESGSCRTDCKWKVNIYWNKRSNRYRISTFTSTHTGHTPDPTTIQFIPKNRKLTDEMLKDIEFYTLSGKINASAQYRLLLEKYKVSIHRSNLYNAITKEEDSRWVIEWRFDPDTSSYSWLLDVLLKATDGLYPNSILTDADPAMTLAISTIWPSTQHLHCIWHIGQNLQKKLKSKLGSDWDSFIKDFYKTRNVLDPKIFENRFKSLQERYPKANQYLNRALYPDRQSWARAYTFRHFTAGAQATSRVESINSHIKSIISRGYTTLYDLFNSLDFLIASQDYHYDFISWKSSNPNIKPPNVCDTMYTNVDTILKTFVAPNLIEKIRYEINHSLFYHSAKIHPESLHLCQENITLLLLLCYIVVQDNDEAFVDNAFDYPLAHSFALFKEVEDKVVEVWEIIHMTWQHSRLHVFLLKDGSYICSCMLLVNRGYPCRHFFRVMAYSSAAKFSINFVAKRWLLEKYQDNDLGIQPLVNLSTVFLSEPSKSLIPTTILRSNESANLFSAQNAMSTMTRLSTSVVAKKAMQKKKVYAETIGIARKAINIAIEKDDPHVLKFLKGYILQNERSLVENTTEASSSGYKTNVLKERPEVNIIPEKSQVSNPVKKARKGRPPKIARYQSSLENPSSKAQEKRPRGPGTNTCGECGGKGHNRRWHSKHENKSYDSGIICELCGGCGHKKELHNHDLIEENENEWVGSSGSESGAEMDNIE